MTSEDELIEKLESYGFKKDKHGFHRIDFWVSEGSYTKTFRVIPYLDDRIEKHIDIVVADEKHDLHISIGSFNDYKLFIQVLSGLMQHYYDNGILINF